jgi:hypothetical protein
LIKRIEKLEGALKIIYTWASMNGQYPGTLHPNHTMNLCKELLDTIKIVDDERKRARKNKLVFKEIDNVK